MMVRPLQVLLVLLCLMGIFPGDHQVFCSLREIPLDMAPNSFDDQYKGCERESKLEDPIHTDFANKGEYVQAWIQATSRWKEKKSSLKVPSDFRPQFGIAVMAYTLNNPLFKDFNTAVREGGTSGQVDHSSFAFKSFHFLLTRALQVLRTSNPQCYSVYRGVRGIRFTISDRNKPVRLGQFASSSRSLRIAQEFGTDTLFTIKTCHGVYINEFSFSPQEEVLIPPYEKFRVTEIRAENGRAFIGLQSDGINSTYNCGKVTGAALSSLSDRGSTLFLLGGFFLLATALGSPQGLL